MAAEPPQRLNLLCSHGGSLLPRGSDGALRYAGGETRVLVVSRGVCFRNLAARLSEMAGGAEVREVRHRLANEGLEDVLVSVACDEEVAHMRDEYDRLRATRPAESFRVFVSAAPSTTTSTSGGVQRRRTATGLPPRPPAPAMRRVQTDHAQLHRHLASSAPVRRIQSAQELAGPRRSQPSFSHRRCGQCGCFCHRRDLPVPAPPPSQSQPMRQLSHMSKNVKIGLRPGGQEAAPAVTSAAKAMGRGHYRDAARQKAMSRDAEAAMEQQRGDLGVRVKRAVARVLVPGHRSCAHRAL